MQTNGSDPPIRRTVVVTGGGGFIGKALVRALQSRGFAVRVLGRNAYPELSSLGVDCRQGDVRDQTTLIEAFRGCDSVFHVAAKAGIWGAEKEYMAINYTGTCNVLAACRTLGIGHLIYTSTPSVVFAGTDVQGADESTPYAHRPLCPYAASKIAAERVVLQANGPELRTLALRPHLVWGPGDQHLIPRLLARGKAGQLKIVGTGTNRVDISYIDNVVDAHILAAEHLWGGGPGAGKAFFIAQEQPVGLWEWINELFARLDLPPVTRKVPFAVAYRAGAMLEWGYRVLGVRAEPRMTRFLACQLAHSHWFSHRRAEQLLGYRPHIATDQGMDQLVAWIRSSGVDQRT